VASIVCDDELSADEREAMLRATFAEYEEFTGRDGLADIASTRTRGETNEEPEMEKNVDVGELAMFVLECAANNIRKANPSLSEAQAFSKAYTDPANHEAMKAERQASRARLVAGYAVAQTEPEILSDVLNDADIKRLIVRERRRFPFLDGEQLLAVVEASDEMKAHRAAVRQAQAAGRRAGSSLEVAKRARDDAMSELQAKAAELRKVMPSLTQEGAFAKAYRLYPDLAASERAASRSVLYA
jgi:hypothetical protein